MGKQIGTVFLCIAPVTLSLEGPWHNALSKYATDYNVKRMRKNSSNRHLTKHNHDKRSI